MLLRNDRQSALNQVETLCLRSADDYAFAASQLDGSSDEQEADATLVGRLQASAERRRELAADLVPFIRELDDLPQSPDPDRATIDHLISGLRSLLAVDKGASLLAALREGDQRLRDALDQARAELSDDAALRLLARLDEELSRSPAAHPTPQ